MISIGGSVNRVIRSAKLGDVDAIVALLQTYAELGLLLPRSKQSVCEGLLSFVVAEEAGRVVGTAALHILGPDLAEIRSLAVVQNAQGNGYGRLLVDTLLDQGQRLEVPKVLALTYQETFFARCGFRVVDMRGLQQKIWKDCIHCKKYSACDEIAMIYETTAFSATGDLQVG